MPIGKFLDEKQRLDSSWLPVRKSYQHTFTVVAMALHKKKLADVGLRPQYVVQNHRKLGGAGDSSTVLFYWPRRSSEASFSHKTSTESRQTRPRRVLLLLLLYCSLKV